MKVNFPIDFVVTWVDGNDPKWQQEKLKYSNQNHDDKDVTRFRDPGHFKYWFRAVEKYASWVNHIYLVTNGQVPKFLNLENEKITLVRHEEVMPADALPTFNSNAIEMCINKIKGLSEHFVLFNDDMFLIKEVEPTDFFSVDGKPKDTAGLNQIMPVEDFDHTNANNIIIINKHFKKREVLRKQWRLFFNIKNGPLNIYTSLLYFFPRFSRLYDLHIPYSLTKTNFDNFINISKEERKRTIYNRFRDISDITIWGLRYYQIVTGNISPRKYNFGKFYSFKEKDKIINDILKPKHYIIDVNDANVDNYDQVAAEIRDAFDTVFTNKSSFEK